MRVRRRWPRGRRRPDVVGGSDDGSFTGSDDLWNGGDELPEVGVTLLGPRAYDPLLGRFLQRDPIAVLRRSSTANPYSFAFSDPVNHSDPTGLTPPECTGSECASTMEVGIAGLGLSLGSSQSRRQRPAPRGRGHGTDRIKVNLKALEAEPQFFGGGQQSAWSQFSSGFTDRMGSLAIQSYGFVATPYELITDPSGFADKALEQAAGLPNAEKRYAWQVASPIEEGYDRIANSDAPWSEAGALTADVATTVGSNKLAARISPTGPSARTGTYGDLKRAGVSDSHHAIQDAAMRDIPATVAGRRLRFTSTAPPLALVRRTMRRPKFNVSEVAELTPQNGASDTKRYGSEACLQLMHGQLLNTPMTTSGRSASRRVRLLAYLAIDGEHMDQNLLCAIRELVSDLARGRFLEVEADGRAGRLTAHELISAIRDYGRTLLPLPDQAVLLIDVYPMTQIRRSALSTYRFGRPKKDGAISPFR